MTFVTVTVRREKLLVNLVIYLVVSLHKQAESSGKQNERKLSRWQNHAYSGKEKGTFLPPEQNSLFSLRGLS